MAEGKLVARQREAQFKVGSQHSLFCAVAHGESGLPWLCCCASFASRAGCSMLPFRCWAPSQRSCRRCVPARLPPGGLQAAQGAAAGAEGLCGG
jgi:hypothetical protein